MNESERPVVENLSFAVASTFVNLCEVVADRSDEALEEEMLDKNAQEFVHKGNPGMKLHGLIRDNYPGTGTQRAHLFEDLAKHGGGEPDGLGLECQYREKFASFREWPKELLIYSSDFFGKGVFSKKGAKEYEKQQLEERITLNLTSMYANMECGEKLYDTILQLREFPLAFGEKFTPKGTTLDESFDPEKYIKKAEKYLKNHPFVYDRDPRVAALKTARYFEKKAEKKNKKPDYLIGQLRFFVRNYDILLERAEGMNVIIYGKDELRFGDEIFFSFGHTYDYGFKHYGKTPFLIKKVTVFEPAPTPVNSKLPGLEI